MSDLAPSPDARRPGGWAAFTTAVMAVLFLQSVTAGRIFAGDDWARTAHRAAGGMSMVVVLGAGIVALVAASGAADRRRLGLTLIGLAVCLYLQFHLGAASADGEDTLWLHIPTGVAMFGLSAHAALVARRLNPIPSH